MQTFQSVMLCGTDRLIRATARFLRMTVYLLPLVPVLYLKLWQDPGLIFESHALQETAIAMATLEGACISYVCWLCYQRSGEVLVKRMTQGFVAFTVVYSLHGMFTPVSTHHMTLFILYGPASRLLMGLLLLRSVLSQNRAVDAPQKRISLRFWWRFLGLLMAINVAVAALATSVLGQQVWPRAVMEAGAMLCNLAALVVVFKASAHTPLMRYYTLALAWFCVASVAFLLAAPWNHLWWLAHGIFAVGFSILGYGLLKAYLTNHALERVFSSEELFEDLAKVNARLVDVFHEYEEANNQLHHKVRELDRSRHSFASFLEAVPDAVLIVETGGTIRDANSAAEQLFGYASGELAGVQVEALTRADLQEAHSRKRERFEFAPRTRSMGTNSMPLPCLRRDGGEFAATISIGGLMVEGQQVVVTFIRPVLPKAAQFALLRAEDVQLIERAKGMDAMLAMVPAMLLELRRDADGTYSSALRSAACQEGLQMRDGLNPSDWVKHWFNQVVPNDLPHLISSIESAALQDEALQLQWHHHVPGRGLQAFVLSSSRAQHVDPDSLVWMCVVKPAGTIGPP